MSNRKVLCDKIVDIEFEMFQNVQNIGGRASCQEDPKTFKIMRSSQFMSWSEDVMKSYLNDLEEVKENKRNLPTEKYARMMEFTWPLEYMRIKNQLPPLDPEVPPLIERIIGIVLEWEEELLREFPHIVPRGRPFYSSEDSRIATSKETYLRGELATYSRKTLELYCKDLLSRKSKGINVSRVVLEEQIKQYGYPSLEKANEVLDPS